jgi:immunity protein 26 of polymorphic toxin system
VSQKKVKYEEGDWFAVPLRKGGFAPGVVARTGTKGIFLGYFFSPKYRTLPDLHDVLQNSAASPVLVALAGDLGLIRGDWKVLGKPWNWRRDRWPLPAFSRRDALTGKASQVTYNEADLLTEERVTPCSEAEAGELPADGVWGYGAIEKRLTALLSEDG